MKTSRSGPVWFSGVAGALTLLATLVALPATARPRAQQVAQLEVTPEQPLFIESRPAAAARIEPAPATTPRIEPRPADDAPRIVAPPLVTGALTAREARHPAIDRELQRLLRQAEAPRNPGSTLSSAQAAWQLGLIYLHGAGVRRDAASAQHWFERAARFGREPWAQAGLAWCYLDGCTGPPNAAAAARAIAQLRPAHPARADFLAWVLASRQAPLQVARPGRMQDQVLELPARPLLERAAAAGDVHANIELGMNAVANDRVAQAEAYFRRAGPYSAAAVNDLRELRARGASAMQPAAPPTNASANEALAAARKYHRGDGVPANFVEAIRFYGLADSRGSVEARRMLGLIYSRPTPTGGVDAGWMQQLAYVDTATVVPTVGVTASNHMLLREPTPLYDLLPAFWRQQMTQVDR
ncbi:tetratricopeptide repeat protein [Ottowia testudinis]|uniref:SEL1-like repeat protein n=1 Tax=Ottowia testudinis TaxID=2816950 RepID=A0A975CLC9_9BURK|nr:SEL1-like repeat protein [Ottowia testudinis]QTD47137.1 SEL1-like repeat protein [Ottowia testudinis]